MAKKKTKRKTKRKAKKKTRVGKTCARRGKISYGARKRLPDKAFALSRERKYPLFRLASDGKTLLPSRSHATNAKARSAQQYDRGNLTLAQYSRIVAKADRVIAMCSAPGARVGHRGNPHSDTAKINEQLRALGLGSKRSSRRR